MTEPRFCPGVALDSSHHWIEITSVDSRYDHYLCAGCGLTKTELKTHWPLYPYSNTFTAPTTMRRLGT